MGLTEEAAELRRAFGELERAVGAALRRMAAGPPAAARGAAAEAGGAPLPADPDGLNDHRARMAVEALRAFMRISSHEEGSDRLALQYFLCDAMHWCDRAGLAFADEAGSAAEIYSAEIGGPPGAGACTYGEREIRDGRGDSAGPRRGVAYGHEGGSGSPEFHVAALRSGGHEAVVRWPDDGGVDEEGFREFFETEILAAVGPGLCGPGAVGALASETLKAARWEPGLSLEINGLGVRGAGGPGELQPSDAVELSGLCLPLSTAFLLGEGEAGRSFRLELTEGPESTAVTVDLCGEEPFLVRMSGAKGTLYWGLDERGAGRLAAVLAAALERRRRLAAANLG